MDNLPRGIGEPAKVGCLDFVNYIRAVNVGEFLAGKLCGTFVIYTNAWD